MNIHNGKTRSSALNRNVLQRTAQLSPETAMRSSAQQHAEQKSAAHV